MYIILQLPIRVGLFVPISCFSLPPTLLPQFIPSTKAKHWTKAINPSQAQYRSRNAGNTMAIAYLKHAFFGFLSFLGVMTVASGYTCTDRGQGSFTCHLNVEQDVWIEKTTTNYDNYDYLIVGKHLNYQLKRTLLQFEDLQASSACTVGSMTNRFESARYVSECRV